jgi:hypothetical protein
MKFGMSRNDTRLSSCPTSGWRNYGDVFIENGELLNDFAGEMRLSPGAGNNPTHTVKWLLGEVFNLQLYAFTTGALF